ncbi:TPA: hypothetical protein N0F65_002314 [Lagenidium giganteum]|uniref:Uncharacterized protein n=1 Tax=Lagenidium giganteum TaxID=4803 RepID=A0AAV2Z538_9STRA|nr:TPA: hypothetical protein N0F65_002314 [Lagenidium giganteum]
MVFIGDGQYVGDGGRQLQTLWEFAPWKEIKNCPGRYIVKHKRRSQLDSDCASSGPATRTDVPLTAMAVAQLLERVFGVDATLQVHVVESEKCQDGVQVVVFEDGGGIITYCKTQAPSDATEEPSVVYVHTLNTTSGLQRKLEGLRLAHLLPSEQHNHAVE